MPSRRTVVRKTGTAAVFGAVTVAGTALARHAVEDEYERTQPSHVTIDFPADLMDRYRPALDLRDADRSRLQGLWGWRATSPEYAHDWYVYWASWTHQTGVTEYDSHLGDHEPAYVAVDPSTGSVEQILFSAYHWLKGAASAPGIPLTSDTHPVLYVVAPWHHYNPGTPGRGILPDVYDLADGSSGLSAWLANGLAEDLLPGSCHDPPTMLAESDWWRNDFSGDLTALQLELFRQLGIHREGGIL